MAVGEPDGLSIRESGQDTRECAALAETYMVLTRCVGGRVVNDGYMCNWCGNDPSEKCGNPRRKRKRE